MQSLHLPTVGAGSARSNKGVYAIPGRADPAPTAYIIKVPVYLGPRLQPDFRPVPESRYPHAHAPTHARTKKRSAPDFSGTDLNKTAATYSPTLAVPSARSGLTSLFGMGRGGTPTL